MCKNTGDRLQTVQMSIWHFAGSTGVAVPRGGLGKKCLLFLLDAHPCLVESQPLQSCRSRWHQKVSPLLTALLAYRAYFKCKVPHAAGVPEAHVLTFYTLLCFEYLTTSLTYWNLQRVLTVTYTLMFSKKLLKICTCIS